MKKIITAIALLLSSLFLRASTFNIAAGAPTSTIQSTINSAAAASGGNIVQFAAGSYSITSQINIPCPASALTIQGPIPGEITFSGTNARPSIWPITPAAILTNNGITNNWGFNLSACSIGTTIQYLEWNGNQPSGGGGGFIHVNLGANNYTQQYNYIHGNMAIQTTQQRPDTHVYLDGGYSSTHTQNTLIRWNRFGSTGSGDCGGNATAATGKGIMSLMGSGGGNGTCYSTSPSGYAPPSGASNSAHSCLYQGAANNNGGGGSCAAFGLAANTDNFSFLNNSVQEQEQGGKCFQAPGSGTTTSTNTKLQFNDFSGIHRIGYEAQCNDGLTTVDSNDWHDPYFVDANSWALSLPQGNTISTNNVLISNIVPVNDRNGNPPSWAGDCIEAWGNQTSSNNLCQGKWLNGIFYGFHQSPFSINNNIFQMTDHTNYITCCDQGAPATPVPAQSGNVTGQTLSARVSVTPTFSPTSGTAPLTITLTDPGYTSGAGPQGNTGIWYTIDGSNPVPGSGTAKFIASGQTFTLASAATVKAVGMWGDLNQPRSYPTNYGFTPSSIVSATFSGSPAGLFISPTGNDVNSGSSSSPWLTPNHALSCGQTITALPGNYNSTNFQNGDWGTVNCPAGNNVVWLACQTFDTCKITSSGTSATDAMWVDKSFWGVQGFETTVTGGVNGACFHAGPSSGGVVHHVIFANNVANGCKGGGFNSYSASTSASVDYITYLGNIAFNAASGTGACYSGFNIFQPIASDTNAGTHMYIAGNFSYGNVDASPCNAGLTTDGEGINLDTFDFSQGGGTAYTQQAVVQNNIVVSNGSSGILVENNKTGSSAAPVFFKQNTTYGNLTATNRSFCVGLGELYAEAAFNVTETGNLSMTNAATGCSGDAIYANSVANGNGTVSVANNWMYSAAGNTTFISASPGFSYGTNTVNTNPVFTNVTIPPAPSCGSSVNVPACMAALVNGFKPTNTSAQPFGYQTPSNTSVSDSLYPQWLCNVTLPLNLITPGCGGGGAILQSITLASTGGLTTFTPGQTNQLIATGHFSDGSTSNISSTANFVSSTPGVGSVTSVGGLYTAGSTTGTTNISASQGIISTTTPLVLTTGTATPTLTGGSISQVSNINTIAIGAGTVPFVANGNYSDSVPRTLPDSFGNTAVWSIVAGSSTCGTVNSSGVFTPTTVGTCNVKVVSAPGNVGFSPWTMTVTAAVVTLQSITLTATGGVSSITVGATVQLIATGHYSDGSTANITGAINSWATSDGTKATISSGGLVTGVAAGSPTFTATQGSVTSTPAFPLTVITGITLQSIVITAPGGANAMLLNWTLSFDAHCLYSNGDNFDCVTTDGHGNAVTWTSSNTLAATFTNNILKEISATHGNGFVTASAASITSANYNMTYAPAGPLIFSLSGINITFSGSSIGISYK